MEYNLLLRWASEAGTGKWQAFKDGHDWILAGAQRNRKYVSPAQRSLPTALRTLSHLIRLGHMEIDWETQTWAVAPPVITIVPGASVHAVMTGLRTRGFMRDFEAATHEDVTNDLLTITRTQDEGPDVIFIACTSELDVKRLAADLEAHYEFSVAERLSCLLPDIRALTKVSAAPPPSTGYEVERWNPSSHTFEQARPTTPGLYRYRTYGTYTFRFARVTGEFSDLDLYNGRFAELNRLGINLLGYRESSVNGTLVVPVWSDLPELHARSAIMCSGLLPLYDPITQTRRYQNVPRIIAERIASSLHQKMTDLEVKT
jgi:hypothetical protein